MPKSIYRPEYTVMRTQIRAARERAGLTQVDLSEAIGASQTYISHVERGVRRLDAVELWDICRAMGLDLTTFIAEFQAAVSAQRHSRVKKAKSSGRPRKRD